MKLAVKYVFVAFLSIAVLASCKKKDSVADAYNKAIVKLLGKWTFVNATINDRHSNADHVTTTPGASGDFMDFMNNGQAAVRLFSSQDTSKYTLVGDSKLIFDDVDQFDIKILTETELVFVRKTVYTADDFKEETYSLRK